jgi:(2Fe-2S) ferredoxin
MPALTVHELSRIREGAKQSVALQERGCRARIVVHMGTCGVAAGAKKVLDALCGEVGKRGLADVRVVATGCAGLCSAEPMASVEVRGSPKVFYAQLTPRRRRGLPRTRSRQRVVTNVWTPRSRSSPAADSRRPPQRGNDRPELRRLRRARRLRGARISP